MEDGKLHRFPRDSFLRFIQNGFEMAEELGVHLWGINVATDPKFYRIYDPIHYKTIIVATFFGIIITDLRFDESVPLKEDYDFALQHIKRDGKIIRFCKFALRTKHHTNPGGCVDYRTSELERQAADRLIQKWGTRVIKLRKTWKTAEKAGLRHYDIRVKL
jgi:hypothetical protein